MGLGLVPRPPGRWTHVGAAARPYTEGMRLLLALLLTPAPAFAVQTARPVVPAVKPPSAIILPGTGPGAAAGSLTPSLTVPGAPSLIIPEAPRIIAAPAPAILAPQPLIVTAARGMTPEEAAQAGTMSAAELSRLADSLAGGEAAPERKGEAPAASLGASFDGSVSRTSGRDQAQLLSAAYFSFPPAGPELHVTARAARALFARLLPRQDRSVEAAVVFDSSKFVSTGHTWSKERGHRIEILPESADGRGEVSTAFGLDGMTRVQRKVERLMLVAHERGHVVFDDAVKRRGDHAPASAYAAMTEGYAVTLEGLFIDRLMADPLRWGIGPRDAADLLAIRRARADWLAAVDTHYAEGVLPWSRALERGGEDGLLSFLAKLSARRMADTPRSDPAYQLAAGDPDLLAAYLGRDAAAPLRKGFEAYAKAARGEELSAEESEAASAAIEAAGPEGRRRVFERVLRVDRAIPTGETARAPGARWWEGEKAVLPSPAQAFALARLSPAGAAELAAYLAENAAQGALARVFGARGPSARLDEVVKGAESLPFTEAERKTWLDGLMDFFVGRS